MPRTLILAGSLALLLSPSSLFAQTIDSFVGIRLRLDNAGARGAAMGGTSEALTDVFAAATNPAALAKQKHRSAAIEVRHTSSSTDFISGGVLFDRHETADVTSTRNAIGAAMVVLPARRVTFALHYDEPLFARMNPGALSQQALLPFGLDISDGLVPPWQCTDDCSLVYLRAPIAPTLDMSTSIRRAGAAAGWSHGNVSLGAALQYTQVERSIALPYPESPFVTPVGTADGGKLAWSTGVQWQIVPALRAGASYRSGATYEEQYSVNFAVPSSYGAGLAADLGPNVTISADAVRVHYSESLGFSPEFPATVDYRFPDVTELHAGAEWRSSTRVPVALRAGWWRDPAHRLRAFGEPVQAGVFNLGLLDADENHVTAGIGIGDRVRFDAAIDRSENTTRGSLSLATNF